VSRFVSTPEVPTQGLIDWQAVLFSAIKENVDLLTGTRGEADLASRAVVRGDVTVANLGTARLTQLSAKGEGYTISGQDLPSLADHGKLMNDVVALADDMIETREALNTLINNMKGT